MSIRALYCSFILLIFSISLSAGPTGMTMIADSLSPPKKDSTIQLKKDSTHRTFLQKAKSYDELDLIDIVNIVIHKKLMEKTDSVRKKEKVHASILGAPGYTQSTGFIGIVSGNLAFFVKDQHNLNQSNVSAEFSYDQYNQSLFAINPNIWTADDKWNIVGENKLMKYPQATFGLGGHTLPSAAYNIDYFLVHIHETALRHIVSDFYIGLGYDLDYHFRIRQLTDSTDTDYDKYGYKGSTSITSGPKVELEWDSRRNSLNPHSGFFATIIYGYFPKFLCTDENYGSLKGDFRTYIPLDKKKRHIIALWNYDWFTFNGHAPYLDLPSTQWDDVFSSGRGYLQGRYRGKNFLYGEVEYRFPLLRDGFFGGVVYANVESVTDYPSNKFTTAAPAGGLGLRIKLNKHSDSNICLDYAWGLHHSQGLNVNIGEVF